LHDSNTSSTTSQQNRPVGFVGMFNDFPWVYFHISQRNNVFRKFYIHI